MNRRETGVVLAIVLVMLLVISLLGLSAARLGTADLRMAAGEEWRLEAQQQAQSLLDAVLEANPDLPSNTQVGEVHCTPGVAGCDHARLKLPAGTPAATGTLAARITRLAPALAPPPAGYSLRCFQTAQFEALGSYDGTVEQRGRAVVAEGYAVLVQNGSC